MTAKLALTGPAETGLIARPTRGSPPRGRYVGARLAGDHDGQVAQLVEQRIENPRVGGSIPPLATIIPKSYQILSDLVTERWFLCCARFVPLTENCAL